VKKTKNPVQYPETDQSCTPEKSLPFFYNKDFDGLSRLTRASRYREHNDSLFTGRYSYSLLAPHELEAICTRYTVYYAARCSVTRRQHTAPIAIGLDTWRREGEHASHTER